MYEMQQCQRISGVDFLTTCVQKAKMHADRDDGGGGGILCAQMHKHEPKC